LTPLFPPHSQVWLTFASTVVIGFGLVGIAFIGPVLLHFFVINVESFTGSSSTLLRI